MNSYRNSFVHTLKEAPKDAEVVSHQLMVRAGLIRKVASGIYSILPLGQRVFTKLSNIIRDEMVAMGAVECELPHLVPAELWQSSGRWDQYGKELLRLRDRSDREFCFGPTHEEVITDLVGHYIHSYKQLPVCLFQVQTKFRDEIRPRFGLMRGREFLMKDAYSFHDGDASLHETYESARKAYSNIFSRCGLNYIEATADSGAIGGDESVEFLVLADSGEDEILMNQSVDYAANVEACVCLPGTPNRTSSDVPDMKMVATPNVRTINDVATFFSVDHSLIIKSLLVIVNDAPSLLCLRGDHSLNETKVAKCLNGSFRFATEDEVQTYSGSAPGFLGPVQLSENIPVYWDHSLNVGGAFICGANQTDAHYQHVVIDREFNMVEWVDIRHAMAGDLCPTNPSVSLESIRGIEVGHVFKLGTKYSEQMGANYTTKDGVLAPYEMGCYGIGVGRTIAATIEQSHDEHGIIWPSALAPYVIVIINLAPKEPDISKRVNSLVDLFDQHHLDVIVDDRVESPGVKFKDADLIGFPFQVILGKKTLERQEIEIKHRKTGDKKWFGFDDYGKIIEWVS